MILLPTGRSHLRIGDKIVVHARIMAAQRYPKALYRIVKITDNGALCEQVVRPSRGWARHVRKQKRRTK